MEENLSLKLLCVLNDLVACFGRESSYRSKQFCYLIVVAVEVGNRQAKHLCDVLHHAVVGLVNALLIAVHPGAGAELVYAS